MRAACLHCEGETHHLDHLCPLALWLGIPVLFTDPLEMQQAQIWYPGLQTECIQAIDTTPQRLFASFDLILYSNWMQMPGKTIFVPHGHSDKGEHSWWMEAFAKEQATLLLGPRMERILRAKKALPPVTIPVGPWRVSHLDRPAEKVILYASTWGGDSSLEEQMAVLGEVPSGYRLKVKLHPRMAMDRPGLVEKIRTVAEPITTPHIFPPLAEAACLISDVSSIVYDFLHFNRPIVLLGKEPVYSSHQFSTVLPKLWGGVEEAMANDRLQQERRSALRDAFYPPRSKEEVLADLERYARS